MNFPTWVEIDLDRLERNIEVLRASLGAEVRILLVVKADAYGHGAVEVGRAALNAGVAMLGIATLHEGIELRQAGVTGPILILSPSLPGELDEIMAHDLRPTLSTESQARDASAWAVERGGRITVHVEIDTGMGRTGLDHDDAFETVTRMSGLPGLEFEGIFTHFPVSDGPDESFTRMQIEKFDRLIGRLDAAGIRFTWRHAANSAAAVRFPDSRLNMVRPGILPLGIHPSEHVRPELPVRPVMSFHSRLVQLRHVPAGRHVSYGATYVTSRDSLIGVIAAGYGHGYSRRLSNRGEVSIRGRRAPIVGRVTMDLTMIDLTEIADAEVGDDVLLFGDPSETEGGRHGAVPVRIEEVADWAETIPWEIMCRIDKRVVRKYVRGGQVVKVMTLVGERLESETGPAGGVLYSGAQKSVRASGSGWKK